MALEKIFLKKKKMVKVRGPQHDASASFADDRLENREGKMK